MLQDADGGFFEKFGSLLTHKTTLSDNYVTGLAAFKDDDEEEGEKGEEENDCSAVTEENVEPVLSKLDKAVYGLEAVPEKTTAKERKDHLLEKAFGMNIEDLYEEVIFEILNNIGCESDGICTETLIEFAQEVFKIPDEQNKAIIEQAKIKEPPKIRLNVEIVKAENLMPKDCNGLSDPFVTLYLLSNSSHRYNSSVKVETLNPTWEEHFSLPIVEGPKEEVLIIEVWDFDAAETMKEKVNKIFDVKGVKGLRKLMKEIAVTASTGKHDNELIGRSTIKLRSIPVNGITVWYNLEKGSKAKSRGSILVNLSLSAEKNKHVALQEHRHLLNLLLMHELECSQTAPYWWNGKFDHKSEAVRSQHAVQSGLTHFECAMCEWSAYASIHEEHPLNFTLFNTILNVIVPVLKCRQLGSEDLTVFWAGAKQILPSCYSVIRKIRSKNAGDKHIVKTLCEILDIISKFKELEDTLTTELFPENIYGWIRRETAEGRCDVQSVTVDAIHTGSTEWLEYVIEGNKPCSAESDDEEVLQYLIKLIQMIRADLQRAIEYFDKHFQQKLQLNYSSTLAQFYDVKILNICKHTVMDICSKITRLQVPDDQFDFLPNIEKVNMGTTLFELYLVFKRFVTLSQSLCPNKALAIETFYEWFSIGVNHWLDISIIKALTRVQKAIDLDQLRAVDDSVKYSSSAVDTLSIFYQIKVFWKQLDWPDIEGSYAYVARIVDDICRCCIFYAKKMSCRIECFTESEQKLFSVSTEWCLAINNIDYIRQSLPAFVKELDIDKVIEKVSEFRSCLEADRCSITIQNVIDNALDTQRNQILELIEIVARKMAPAIKNFLAEGAEVLHKDSNSMEKLMIYLEQSLEVLYETLNELNFARILDAIWNELSIILYDLIQANLDKRRPPVFFQNLKETLNIMISCFKVGGSETCNIPILAQVEKTLDLHAFETADLIHQYYLERLGFQRDMSKSEYGQLTIRASFTDSALELDILNARNLLPMDQNGSCDPFVKATFLPVNNFIGVTTVKTSVQKATRFPLYDEHFTIPLSEEQRSKHNSLILFSIKDKDLLTSQYIAECYITFADIMGAENEQIHLELSRPEYSDSETLKALEYRQGDKQAKEFLKKLKNKS